MIFAKFGKKNFEKKLKYRNLWWVVFRDLSEASKKYNLAVFIKM